MIAIGPREIGKACLVVALFHIAQQCLAGFVQCSKLGCLPW